LDYSIRGVKLEVTMQFDPADGLTIP